MRLNAKTLSQLNPCLRDNTEVLDWVNQTYERLSPFFNGHAYQNYDMGKDCPLTSYFGPHTERLIALKKKFDPKLRFAGSLQQHLK